MIARRHWQNLVDVRVRVRGSRRVRDRCRGSSLDVDQRMHSRRASYLQ